MLVDLLPHLFSFFFFFFNDTATTEIYTLSLHDALPIGEAGACPVVEPPVELVQPGRHRSEEHTSELQSPCNLVCRLLLEKKKIIIIITFVIIKIHIYLQIEPNAHQRLI